MKRPVLLAVAAAMVFVCLLAWVFAGGDEPTATAAPPATVQESAPAPSYWEPDPELVLPPAAQQPADVPLDPAAPEGGTDPATGLPTREQLVGTEPSVLPAPAPAGPTASGPAVAPARTVRAPRVVFNDPTGSRAQQFAIPRAIEAEIRRARRGSTITVAVYSFSLGSTRDALLAAHRRGVNVRVLSADKSLRYGAFKKLRSVLGTSTRAGSYATVCHRGCMSGSKNSIMHAKFFLFSGSGGGPVSMLGSANLTNTQATSGWNNLFTTYDPATYTMLSRYFADMVPDRSKTASFRQARLGDVALYLYPKRTGAPLMRTVFDGVRCTGAAPGYGTSDGRTLVRVAMYHWNNSRAEFARKLWQLHDQGCRVEVVVKGSSLKAEAKRALGKNSATYGRIPIHDAAVKHGGRKLYPHHKTVMISGNWAGRAGVKAVWGGSQNFTRSATTVSNELVFRSLENRIYDAYARNFTDIFRHHSKRI